VLKVTEGAEEVVIDG